MFSPLRPSSLGSVGGVFQAAGIMVREKISECPAAHRGVVSPGVGDLATNKEKKNKPTTEEKTNDAVTPPSQPLGPIVLRLLANRHRHHRHLPFLLLSIPPHPPLSYPNIGLFEVCGEDLCERSHNCVCSHPPPPSGQSSQARELCARERQIDMGTDRREDQDGKDDGGLYL